MNSPVPGGASAGASSQGPGPSDQSLEESNASQARIAPRRWSPGDPQPDARPGGDASKAPSSLSPGGLEPIEASSGVSWDDPDEL